MVFELNVKCPDLADQLPKIKDDDGEEVVPTDVYNIFERYVRHGEYVKLRFNTGLQTVEVLTA